MSNTLSILLFRSAHELSTCREQNLIFNSFARWEFINVPSSLRIDMDETVQLAFLPFWNLQSFVGWGQFCPLENFTRLEVFYKVIFIKVSSCSLASVRWKPRKSLGDPPLDFIDLVTKYISSLLRVWRHCVCWCKPNLGRSFLLWSTLHVYQTCVEINSHNHCFCVSVWIWLSISVGWFMCVLKWN